MTGIFYDRMLRLRQARKVTVQVRLRIAVGEQNRNGPGRQR